MDRRTFLKIAGMGSVAIASGCSSEPEKTLYALVQAPDDMVTGKPAWYATTCRECPAGCGLLVKNREGRAIKIEGNPLHPINRGKLCMRGQAALQSVYNPDRIKTPLLKSGKGWQPISFARAASLFRQKTQSAARKGPERIFMLTETAGESMMSLFSEALSKWDSAPPLVFEPFAYEALKKANEKIFGIHGLASYRLHRADFLLSFGADFLETWLSPVEYTIKFQTMRGLKKGGKHRFSHISPFQSLTGANADTWIPCHPGSETALALSIANELIFRGKGRRLPRETRTAIRRIVLPFTKERALSLSGIDKDRFNKLLDHLAKAKRPLILGTASGATGGNDLQANMAVNILNFLLDPKLALFDFHRRHRVEIAASRNDVLTFFDGIDQKNPDLLLLNNVNPVYVLSTNQRLRKRLAQKSPFTVSFSNFMDETTALSDLIIPVRLPLETWDDYSGRHGMYSTLQPVMGALTDAPHLGDLFLQAIDPQQAKDPTAASYKAHLYSVQFRKHRVRDPNGWVNTLRAGGNFDAPFNLKAFYQPPGVEKINALVADFKSLSPPATTGLTFIASPSIRFFDGRGANKPWLCEIPDPLTKVAWQTPVRIHPQTASSVGFKQGSLIKIQTRWGTIQAPVYETHDVKPNVLVMDMGQGHRAYGRYARGMGTNPFDILSPETEPACGSPRFFSRSFALENTSNTVKLAHTDGSRYQHGRKIALSIPLSELSEGKTRQKSGLTMDDFPLTLPLAEGYDKKRDAYPPHSHDGYRWTMVIDLDKCVGCGACMAACYAENNVGVVGVEQLLLGREMSWIRVERYVDRQQPEKVTFLPMLCQHCDNAPCESVCPVYAPHHSKEGLNNQIYNRCIGTRFCAQNCPYKVRRFNWYTWERPSPLNLQLNPDVTARAKGVMEKCSFCIQRIKYVHGVAKNENRKIRDGEVRPACLQSCPTGAMVFGSLMDNQSQVRRLVSDPRAYQVMGFLNTKPAVIYLKKVRAEV